jgi:CopG family transcriptional regulator, nickel-responsive regulator
MSDLQRIGVAIEGDLLDRFDKLLARRGYTNRSEAFRDLARAELMKESAEAPDAHVVGSVTIVYDHHVRLLSEKLTDLQHQYHHCVLSSLHVHLDHDNCLEVIILRGMSREVHEIADALISTKGVKNGRLTIAEAQPSADHPHHRAKAPVSSGKPKERRRRRVE